MASVADPTEISIDCGTCGAMLEYVECWHCGGSGEIDEDDPDFGEVSHDCGICDGEGGWTMCSNAREHRMSPAKERADG